MYLIVYSFILETYALISAIL